MKTTLKRAVGRAASNGAGVLPRAPVTPVTRYGPPRRSPLRVVAKVLGWILTLGLVTAAGVLGGVWLYFEHGFAATAPSTPEERAAQDALDTVPSADQPAVAMVIGYDKRYGEERGNAQRSDTIMLIRADPRARTISLLSFPRDLRVELPPCKGFAPRVGRINEAFTDCGPRGTIETVRKLAGIPINYFVTVDFRAFIQIVNDLGGIYVDVDRRYFNDNSDLPPGQRYATINLRSGYQRLNGDDALAFVRYRHTDSDLYRNARQQEFVKAVKQQVSGLSAAWKLRGIVNAITSNVTVGSGGGKELDLETVLSYAKLAYELPSGAMSQARLEGLAENASYELIPSRSSIERAVDAFMNPDPEAGSKAASVAVGEKPRSRMRSGPPASRVTVEVLNGNAVAGAADDAAYLLSKRGYQAVNGGNADRQDVFETQIFYDPDVEGAEGAADDMAKLFGDAEIEEAPPGVELETMLRVVVGQTFQGTLAPVPRDATPKRTKPKVVKDPGHAAALVREAQRKVRFPLLLPAVRESASELSSLEPIRVYRLNGDRAVRLVYNGPSGTDYWGIQQTSWTDAPILEGPTATRRIGGREYRLYFSGSRLDMVAFEENGAVYWVSNTLLGVLSNETMLEIAKGLRPLGR
jgi:LCP family protein required for cell wall assembly